MRRVLMILALMLPFAMWGIGNLVVGEGPDAPATSATRTTGSCTEPCDADLASLPEPYREMAMRILSVPATERPPLAVCFTPDTDPAVVDRFNEIMATHEGNLDYFVNGRWSTTANGSTGTQGNPAVLTYSFVPDGVALPSGAGEPAAPNSLNAIMNSRFGSTTLWKQKFAQCFARWTELTGVHYVEVSDDGASFPNSPGQLGSRGDVRIASHPIDGSSGILAYNYFPNTGDMVLDASEAWGNANADYRFFRNIILHEHGHGLGISHVCPTNQTKLMEPYLSLSFDGPQHDDTRAGQRNYGDRYENNDTPGTATNLGSIGSGTTVSNVSADNAADTDWYRFTVGTSTAVSATLTPVGAAYYSDPQTYGGCPSPSQRLNTVDDQNLNLQLYASDGTTVLASAAAQPAGVAEVLAGTNVSAGTYYLRVVTASTNNEVQLYNLAVATGGGGGDPDPALTVAAPNGGESWAVGASVTISWTSSNFSDAVNVQLNRTYPTGTWEALESNGANDGSCVWTVSGATSSSARIRVCGATQTSVGDTSNANFAIGGGTPGRTITVTAPNGGDSLRLGSTANITWTSSGLAGYVRIELNRNYPSGTWETLAYYTGNDGSHPWSVSGAASSNARVRIRSTSYASVGDTSNANFVIAASGGGGNGTLTVTYPNGGEVLAPGATVLLRWTSNNVPGYVRLQVNYNYPTGSWQSISSLTANDGVYTWRLGTTLSTTARVRVLSYSNSAIADISDGDFTIRTGGAPMEGLTGLAPEETQLGGAYPNPFNPATTIRFDLAEDAQVRLEVFDISGRLVATLADGAKAAGSHSVTFDGSRLSAGMYLVRLQAGTQQFVKRMHLVK